MKRKTVSTYEDGCADQADKANVWIMLQTYCSLRTSFFLREVLFMLPATSLLSFNHFK
ncbi:hypothetical protein [Peribacillus sp. NPDC096540]|uniref:hypothetical protein n=1 Tax=Peribacillus sp. NPDC096540 TaxID=3390612 RepID=UPI003CFD275F